MLEKNDDTYAYRACVRACVRAFVRAGVHACLGACVILQFLPLINKHLFPVTK